MLEHEFEATGRVSLAMLHLNSLDQHRITCPYAWAEPIVRITKKQAQCLTIGAAGDLIGRAWSASSPRWRCQPYCSVQRLLSPNGRETQSLQLQPLKRRQLCI